MSSLPLRSLSRPVHTPRVFLSSALSPRTSLRSCGDVDAVGAAANRSGYSRASHGFASLPWTAPAPPAPGARTHGRGLAVGVDKRSMSGNSAPPQQEEVALKLWTAKTCLDDHKEVFSQLPNILGAYVGPHAIKPYLNESIMVTINSANQCPYCTGLHGELARMAGVSQHAELMQVKSVHEARQIVDEPAITYARIFADHGGRGSEVATAFETLKQECGVETANSVNALCWFLKWGSVGGNTLNKGLFSRIQSKPVEGSSVLFEVLYTAYYGPLFAVIAGLNMVLKCIPTTLPSPVLSSIGVILTVVAGSWITPVGVLSHAIQL